MELELAHKSMQNDVMMEIQIRRMDVMIIATYRVCTNVQESPPFALNFVEMEF